MSQADSQAYLNRYERLLMQLTEYELGAHAEFLAGGSAFWLRVAPVRHHDRRDSSGEVVGELPRRSGEAYLYRLGQ